MMTGSETGRTGVETEMKLIVGLGNPGFKYRHTRHNIGFMVLDKLASDFRIKIKKHAFDSILGAGKIKGQDVVLAKPLTYMNLSGRAVAAIIEDKGISAEDLLVIMDDIDLPLGKIRVRPKGSSGGHKGVSSIIKELGTRDFPRLRIGIAGEEEKRAQRASILSDYVLRPFRGKEKKALSGLISRCADCALAWIEHGTDTAMNRFNP